MSLSLKEKQLLRSIVELIVQNPPVAKRLFQQVRLAKDLEFSSTIEKIEPLISVVNNFEYGSHDYFNEMEKAVAKLRDNDARLIVKSSISGLDERNHLNSLAL